MWTAGSALADLPPAERATLAALPIVALPAGHVLFHAGDLAQGFLMLLEGRVEVFLTGPTGREILLYAVVPGQSCIQTTLGLMGDEAYSGAAVTACPSRAIIIPRSIFLRLMDGSTTFRTFVFKAFGMRMAEMTQLLERVAFQKVECRLAAALLSLTEGDEVRITQEALATRIGSAREVISRRLETLAVRGLITTARGKITLVDRAGLQDLAVECDLITDTRPAGA